MYVFAGLVQASPANVVFYSVCSMIETPGFAAPGVTASTKVHKVYALRAILAAEDTHACRQWVELLTRKLSYKAHLHKPPYL